MAKKLWVYLHKSMRDRARDGKINFLNRVENAVGQRGVSVEYCLNSDENILRSAERNGYSLFHMDDPHHENALTMRKVYFYPFWQIENSAKRWEWEVAKTPFKPADIDQEQATTFATQWKMRLFNGRMNPNDQGFIYMPLQGKLLKQRSFQSCSPIEMIRQTLKHGPKLPIIATLHPNEHYTPDELAALAEVMDEYPEFSLLQNKSPEDLLPECEYVVTQNSGVALLGYFWHRPVVLFGQSDFHHIALNVGELGAEKAFRKLKSHRPAYDRYLYWFLQIMSINAGRPETEEKILEILRRRGWDL